MHLLLATDGSDIALDAANRAVALVPAASEITLISVIGVVTDTGGGIEGPIYTPEQEEELHDSETRAAAHALAACRAAIAAKGSTATIDQRIDTGDPAAVICLVARQLHVDLVVVGSHGKGFLSRALLGSVSEYVTRHAPCPVLIVRAGVEAPSG